jgi:flagellar motor switch protein FliN
VPEAVQETVAPPTQSTPPEVQTADSELKNLRFLYDAPITYQAVLGKTRLILKDILELGIGSILELNKLANEVVDIYVEDKLVANGEVVVIDENFGVRIISLISKGERVEASKKVGNL